VSSASTAAAPPDCVSSLDELVALVEARHGLFVRWTTDVDRDLDTRVSRDELTGVELPGLSANALDPEPWWDDRPMRTWVARRLYDYRHLVEQRGPGTRPWVLTGTEVGRGPDNEPLIDDCEVVTEVTMDVMEEAVREIDRLPADWGSLRRS
jgi:hypothetical protein